MAVSIDAKLQKRAIEVADHFRQFYQRGIIPIILSLGDRSWAGMIYPAGESRRIYAVGNIEERRKLYHLPDSEDEWYASNTLKENITPGRESYHPFGPSLQLMSLTRPTTDQQLELYEQEYSDKWARVALDMCVHDSRLNRWEAVPRQDLKRVWPFAPKEPVHDWRSVRVLATGEQIYCQGTEAEVLAILSAWKSGEGSLHEAASIHAASFVQTSKTADFQVTECVSFPENRNGGEIRLPELISWFPRRMWDKIETMFNHPQTHGMALYLNRELYSGRGPCPVAYPFGPAWTMKDRKAVVSQVGEMPSQFRYLEATCSRPT